MNYFMLSIAIITVLAAIFLAARLLQEIRIGSRFWHPFRVLEISAFIGLVALCLYSLHRILRPKPVASKDIMTQQITTTPTGLQYINLKDAPAGAEHAKRGDMVTVHYTGWLYENGQLGQKFDSSVDRGEPFVFPLGAGMVIRGWDEGVALMSVGQKVRLIIPASLGYGPRGIPGVIPGNAILAFDVELLGIE